MVAAQFSPITDYSQLQRDSEAHLAMTPKQNDQLPAYSHAMKGRDSFDLIDEKTEAYQPSIKTSSKMASLKSMLSGNVRRADELPAYSPSTSTTKTSTLKSILTGEVHKHNAMYSLERSLDASSAARANAAPAYTRPTSSSSPKTSTFKSILTGDVHKHNSKSSWERHLDAQSAAQASRPKAKSSTSTQSSTLKSILTGNVHQHNAMKSWERHLDASSHRN